MEQPCNTTPTLREGARITLGLTFNAVYRRFLKRGVHNRRGYLALMDKLSPANRFRLRQLEHRSPDLANTMNEGIDYWAGIMSAIFEVNDLLKGVPSQRAVPKSFENLLPRESRPAIKQKADTLLKEADPDGLALMRAMKAPVTDENARKVIHGHFMAHTFETKGPMVDELLGHDQLNYEARGILSDLSEAVSRYQTNPDSFDEDRINEVGGSLLYMDPLQVLLNAKRKATKDEYEQQEGETVEWTVICSLGTQFYGRELKSLEALVDKP